MFNILAYELKSVDMKKYGNMIPIRSNFKQDVNTKRNPKSKG